MSAKDNGKRSVEDVLREEKLGALCLKLDDDRAGERAAGERAAGERAAGESVAGEPAAGESQGARVLSGVSLRTALEALRSPESRGAVVVLDADDALLGIFTERDYLDKVVGLDEVVGLDGDVGLDDGGGHAKSESLLDGPIDAVMTSSPKALTTTDTVDAAIHWMTEGGYRHLPVVDGSGKLHGVLSTHDIIVHLAEYFPMEVYNLPPRLHQHERMNSREGG